MSGGDKKIVVYIDVLFGINLLMDFIVLCIVNKVCKFAATFLRLLLSAAFGALWSVFAVMMPRNVQGLIHICTYILISFLMIKMCAGKSVFRKVLKGVFVLYGVTFVMAGTVNMLYYYTYAGYFVKTVVLSNGKLVLFTAVSVIFIYFLYVQLIKLKVYDEGKCRVIIFCMGEKAELTGFVDTGNVLVDIYTKKPVSVVPRKYIQNILNKIDDYTKVKYHIIPFRSLGCENGMIEVISVESMYIYLGKKEMIVENALIGYTDMELSGDNEYEMLVNAGLLR
ncbi:MAG: sigma-E processing peptidase SpoIIGA [Lachnospira sp.]|mgnify:FL=1